MRPCLLLLAFLAGTAHAAPTKQDEALREAVSGRLLSRAVQDAEAAPLKDVASAEWVLQDGKLWLDLRDAKGALVRVPPPAAKEGDPAPEASRKALLEVVRNAEKDHPCVVKAAILVELGLRCGEAWILDKEGRRRLREALPIPPADPSAVAGCEAELKQIGVGIMLYMDEHRDPPRTLDALVSGGQLKDLERLRTGYGYIPPPSEEPKSPSSWVVLYDDPPRHEGKRCVLFLDFHIAQVPEDAFRKAMAAQGHPLPEAPKP